MGGVMYVIRKGDTNVVVIDINGDGSPYIKLGDLTFETKQGEFYINDEKFNLIPAGYLVVNTLEDRNQLPSDLKAGTMCYVYTLDATYRKKADGWVQVVDGGSGGGGGGGEVPLATKETAGIVIIGSNLIVDQSGCLSVDVADVVTADDSRPVSAKGVYKHVGELIVGPIFTNLTKI